MDDLEQKSLEFAVKIMEDYAPLIAKLDAGGLRLLLQRTYMEGYGYGLQKSHDMSMKVIETVLGVK